VDGTYLANYNFHWKEVITLEKYERPQVLATYTIDELMDEAAVCMAYGGGGGNTSNGPSIGTKNSARNPNPDR
jgi:hypothetical protein